MSRTRLTIAVATWEFCRFWKVRDQLISLALGLAIGLLVAGVKKAVTQPETEPVEIVVVGGEALGQPELRVEYERAHHGGRLVSRIAQQLGERVVIGGERLAVLEDAVGQRVLGGEHRCV